MSSAHTEQSFFESKNSFHEIILAALTAFLNAPTWGETGRILAAKASILLAENTLALLQQTIILLRSRQGKKVSI